MVSFDEMSIKSKLVYQRRTGKLVGFTELGDVNEELRSFRCSHSNESADDIGRDFATHVLVFMVRGIFTSLQYPFGYFATMGASAAEIYPCAMEAIRILTAINLKVRALVSDGASPNRKFYVIVTDGVKNFSGFNPHSPNQCIYVIFDPPHLMKTTRNNAENSNWNNNTRYLFVSYFNFPLLFCLFESVGGGGSSS